MNGCRYSGNTTISNLFKIKQIIKAASKISGCREFIVIGSSAFYFYGSKSPAGYEYSYEVDIYQRNGNLNKFDEIEGSLGEMSRYHETHAIYAHCVSEDTAIMAENWYSRAGEHETDNIVIYYPIPADLAISKLAANRDKDIKFVTMLMENGLVTAKEIEQYLPEVRDSAKRKICDTNLRVCKAAVEKKHGQEENEGIRI